MGYTTEFRGNMVLKDSGESGKMQEIKDYINRLVEDGDIADFEDYVFDDYQALLNGDFFINPVDVEATALLRSKSKDGEYLIPVMQNSTGRLLTDLTPVGVLTLFNLMANSRRMKRSPSIIDSRMGYYGVDGVCFVDKTSLINFGQNKDDSIIDYNLAPLDLSLWLQWNFLISGEEIIIAWDGGEKFYDYEEWLDFIYNSLLSVGLSFSGKIEYRGEDWDDSGVISY